MPINITKYICQVPLKTAQNIANRFGQTFDKNSFVTIKIKLVTTFKSESLNFLEPGGLKNFFFINNVFQIF